MSETSRKFNFILILIVLLGIILIGANCGSSDNSFVGTNANINTPSNNFTNTPTPSLTSKPVSGYIYLSNTSFEDGENIANTTVIDIPAVYPDSSGSIPLLTQLSALQQENPQDWQGEDMKELSDKLFATLKDSQALPETAKVFSKYQDALNESPIPVNNGGYISGQAVVGDKDNNVQLEISLDDDNYIDAETIIPSENITSSDATGVTLKSCPEKIITFPGEVTILKIYSTINLEKTGLTVTLNNPALGCLSKPVILDVCGKKKHDTAYIFFYARKNLTTPIDGKIIARTNTGLELEIFTEIVKSCASISGKVFTGGKPLIKGYVKSIGPKAFCKLDSSGNYTLPRVFRGHFRKITATYWIEDNNGKKIRHREEKIIDFFNSDLTNFNFGEEPTPIPTFTPTPTTIPTPRPWTDPFYFDTDISIMIQRDLWAEDIGEEQAVQKTVNWLNGNLDYPIPEGIAHAEVNSKNSTEIWVTFTDGTVRLIATTPFIVDDTLSSQNFIKSPVNNKLQTNSAKATTVGSDKVVILAPFAWQNYSSYTSVYSTIWDKLVAAGYQERGSKCIATTVGTSADIITEKVYDKTVPDRVIKDKNTIDNIKNDLLQKQITPLNSGQEGLLNERIAIDYKNIDALSKDLNVSYVQDFTQEQINVIWNNMVEIKYYKEVCSIRDLSHIENIIKPEDFQDLSNYGVIYIATHGNIDGIACCPMYKNATFLDPNNSNSWVNKNKDTWFIADVPYRIRSAPNEKRNIQVFVLKKNFFINQDFSKSLVFLNACNSFGFLEQSDNPFHSAKVYLGMTKESSLDWGRDISYYFFLYMIDGYQQPIGLFPGNAQGSISDPDPSPPQEPMSVQKAIDTFANVTWVGSNPLKKANPDPHNYTSDELCKDCQDCELKLKPLEDPTEEIYFPVPVTITIHKNN